MNELGAVTSQLSRLSIDPLLADPSPGASLKDLVRKAFFENDAFPLTLPFTLLSDSTSSIAQFRQQYAPHIRLITTKSWHELKEERGDTMKEPLEPLTVSLEAFRDMANELINQIANRVGQLLEFREPSWSAYGTVGYKSDVDLTVQASSLEEAVWYKIMRDLVHTYVFEGESGWQLDTACFIPHAAEFDLAQFLLYEGPRSYFQTGELAAIALQACMSLGANTELYEAYKKQDLESIADEKGRAVMGQIYAQAEECMRAINVANPTHLLLTLAEEYTRLEQKIHRTVNVEELNRYHLEQQRCLLVISALQKGGTVSVAEGKSTLLQGGGQKNAQERKKRAQSLTEYDNGNPEVIAEISQDVRFGRKLSAPITGQLARRNSISREIARRVYGADVEKFLRPKCEKPDGETQLVAAYEESWQLIPIITEGLKTKEPSSVAVEAGKYADRILRNLVGALSQLNAPSGLTKRAKELEHKCNSLDACKRAVRINTHAATLLVEDVIFKIHEARGSTLDSVAVGTRLERMFSKFDQNCTNEDEIIIAQRHLSFLKDTLREAKELWVDPHHEDILPVLQGHAGYNVPKALHEKARVATITKFDLTTEERVLALLQEILKLGQDARNWARKNGHLVTPSEQMAKFYDFVYCMLV